jgi:hypothetical protein
MQIDGYLKRVPARSLDAGQPGVLNGNGRRDPSGGSRSIRTIVRWGSFAGDRVNR